MTEAAVVTGGAGALGRSIARRLRDEVGAVLLVDVDEERLARVAGELGVAHVAADLAAADAASAAGAALDDLGWVPRVLVNNAGINRDARAMKMSDQDFAAVVRVDLVAPARLATALQPRMPAGGAIVNVASRAALGSFGQANYAAAKAGLIGLTRALALRWAPQIRVNVVAPGLVDTPMTAGMPDKVLSRLVARVPAGRMGEPEEIAATVAFLASPAASYVTGQVVLACGGRSIAP
ncbi:MAG: SDR family oxidoreductase [Actinomycetota bacterium]|nr:SDR family oxidoreductase [Actinomycetota bacterium]